MNIGLYQSASALSALEQWQDVVAQNITSGQVSGFRKRTVEFSTQPAGGWQLDPKASANADLSQQALFPKVTNGISFTPGENQPTGRDLDLAIQGDGYFQVQRPDGSKAYTRSGQFTTRADHTLIDSAGDTVLSDSGSPIVLQSDTVKVTVNPDGSVLQNGGPVGRVGVVNFSDTSGLTPIAGGMFVSSGASQAQPVAKPSVMQGFLESSNVAPLKEMVNLVLISRAYDANQRVITNADDQMQKELDALG
jgi:flagellar basal body rod protein FlgG